MPGGFETDFKASLSQARAHDQRANQLELFKKAAPEMPVARTNDMTNRRWMLLRRSLRYKAEGEPMLKAEVFLREIAIYNDKGQ